MFKLYAALGAAAALLAAGAALDRCTPVVGANARIDHFKGETATAEKTAADWKRKHGDAVAIANGWEASFRSSEGLRLREQQSAVAAVDEAARACDARVARARAAASAIRDLVTKEPTRDPNGCPVRQLVDPGRLRNAIAPPAAPG